ncbi:M23 family metallopeptidase [Microbacterium dextranolyticum]|uniref:M23 family metallopeptidase n=1 Tax=Microbacterium dextranolyticum TaxID=36806 RepID=UPI00195E76A5|nr:M23 family metallopeptidase [Microbacterium dextranolyticum]MBM7463895.1 murein DD-endopeptidase MepM/ murein hydrolase activator NlpD [Microbacterium dextranolyticum]
MTPDTPTANAAPTRRSSRRPSAQTAPEDAGVLTRAELRRRAAQAVEASVVTADAATAPEPEAPTSLAESVVADVAAAIVAETIGAPTDSASRRRLRRAAEAVFAHVAEDAPLAEHAPVAEGTPVDAAAPSGAAFTAPASCPVDEFELAARLFSFTGETPVQRAAADAGAPASVPRPVAAASMPVAAGRRRGVVAQRAAAASFSVGVMAIVGLLAVGTTTPAAAVAAPTSVVKTTADISTASAKTTPATGDIQAFVSSGASGATALDRPEHYKVASMAQIASDSGVTLFANTWVNDPTAAIQWPFPVGVPISAAFGSVEYQSEFASPHNGVDLTPGAGAEIHAIAAGTVRIATEDGGDYGVTVVIDHIVDGQPVSTRYGHMQYGSLKVSQGQKVTAGQVIGRVGQTGKATGPHLHFEVILGGVTRIDPMPWMYAHTTGTHTVG